MRDYNRYLITAFKLGIVPVRLLKAGRSPGGPCVDAMFPVPSRVKYIRWLSGLEGQKEPF